MSAIVVVLVGFGAGLFTMIIVGLYKRVLQIWNSGLR